jgi:hypothetical protein
MKVENTKWTECDEVLLALQEQGLTVRLHNRLNNTWHIADGGLYNGYVVTGDELVELKRLLRGTEEELERGGRSSSEIQARAKSLLELLPTLKPNLNLSRAGHAVEKN